MDAPTTLLLLSIASFIFCSLLFIFQYNKSEQQKIPYWTIAKFLQGLGSLLLYYSGPSPETITGILSSTILLLGCSYEGWAACYITEYRVTKRTHLTISALTIAVCLLTIFISPMDRDAVVFALHSTFYLIPCLVLLNFGIRHSSLKYILSGGFLCLTILYSIGSLSYMSGGIIFQFHTENIIKQILPFSTFFMFIVISFSMLLLAKEKIDIKFNKAKSSLEATESQYQMIVETASEGIMMLDRNFTLTYVNQRLADILGYSREEMTGTLFYNYFHTEQIHQFKEQTCKSKLGQDAVYEQCLKKKDGSTHWMLISAKSIADGNGKFSGSFAMLTDINDRKNFEDKLQDLNTKLAETSITDSLTGLYNRRHLDDRLKTEYNRLSRNNLYISIMLIDIDYFKKYNDYYGHVAGDECLKKVSRIIVDCFFRPSDLVVRFGGEEFLCVLPETDASGALHIAEKIRTMIIKANIEHNKSEICNILTVSTGIYSVVCSPSTEPSSCILAADKALYAAKSNGRNRIEVA